MLFKGKGVFISFITSILSWTLVLLVNSLTSVLKPPYLPIEHGAFKHPADPDFGPGSLAGEAKSGSRNRLDVSGNCVALQEKLNRMKHDLQAAARRRGTDRAALRAAAT
jgi:hypothetical protein